MNSVKTSVGIDVSKAVLDLYAHPTGVSQQVSYDPVGVGGLVAELQALEPDIVVLEATGGLEVSVVSELAAAQLPVVVVNPRQVRDFAVPRDGWPRRTGWTPECWPSLGPE